MGKLALGVMRFTVSGLLLGRAAGGLLGRFPSLGMAGFGSNQCSRDLIVEDEREDRLRS